MIFKIKFKILLLRHVWEFSEECSILVDLALERLISFAFEVLDQGEWVSLGQSTLDLSQQKSSHVTLEIADNEDPICELSLQMRQLKS